MRVVIAPFNRMSDVTLACVRAAGHEVLCTGVETLSYQIIEAQYPAGWKPDVFIFWSPEYNPIPSGLESAPCFKVGVFGDWNLGGQAVQQTASMYDLLIADANGADRLRALGFENTATAPLWSYDPDLHRCVPGITRDIDILLIGNFNHDIQRERARWLGRVARLSSRHYVCLTSGVNGEAYTQLMNRAKIVFNRSIRGEINMRAYEAAACGALLFYERENREISSLYRDREECVLYGEDDLEQLLDYYLSHDEEREKIAAAGRNRVRVETPALHISAIFETIERAMAAQSVRKIAAFSDLAAYEQELRRVRQWLLSADVKCLRDSDEALSRAQTGGADRARVADLRAHLLALAGHYAPVSDKGAAFSAAYDQWYAVASLDPESASVLLNLAALGIERGDLQAAYRHALAAHDIVTKPNSGPGMAPGDLFWKNRFSAFGVEYEKIEIACRHGSEEWNRSVQSLLKWRASELLSGICYAEAQFEDAERYATQACDLYPDMSSSWLLLAQAHHALGRIEAAAAAYTKSLTINPFLVESRESLAQMLIDVNRSREALETVDEWRAIIAACPPYGSCLPEADRLARAARDAARSELVVTAPGCRILAFPDWSRPDDWQAQIDAFTRRRESRSDLLMLWAEPGAHQPARLLHQIAAYLTDEMRLRPEDFPSLTIVSQAMSPCDYWKLFRAADFVARAKSIPHKFKEAFDASGLSETCLSDRHSLAA